MSPRPFVPLATESPEPYPLSATRPQKRKRLVAGVGPLPKQGKSSPRSAVEVFSVCMSGMMRPCILTSKESSRPKGALLLQEQRLPF